MKQIFYLSLVFVSLFSSCSSDKKIKLIEKNFEDEIEPQTALSFTFNQVMVPDSLVGVWTDINYIDFEPEAEGKFHWQTTGKLVFIPLNGFKPATWYKGKFTDKVFKYNKKAKFVDDKVFSFHTPLLQVLASRAFWELNEETGENAIKVEMEFNYPVAPDNVSELLSISVKDDDMSLQVLSTEISDNISILINGVPKEDEDYPVEIKLEKGLSAQGGSESTTEVYLQQFDIPSPFKLEITDVQSNHDGGEGTITLFTTQEAVLENIKDFISISPSVRYTVETESGYILIKSENFSIDQHYELTVKEGLSGKIGGKLKYEFIQPVSFGKVKPTIRFYDQKEYYLSGKGSRNIQVAILNVPKVSIKISKIYENNLIHYLGSRNNNYYYDYEYEEYYYDNAANIGNLGDVIYEETIETSTLPRKGSNRVLTLDFEDKLADNKGIYVLEVRSDENYWLRASQVVAISDIGLIVKEGKNQITVFANSIKTAQSLANVELKFIGRNNQVTHTAKTDVNGVAVFEFSEFDAPGFATSLITAQLGTDFNMIPISNTRINTSRFDVGGKHENPSGVEAFVYGERSLYRPGETINITAIVRDYEWKSPGNIPVILKFIAPNGKTYKTLRKILTEYGSFETQIDLPSSAQTGSYIANVYTSNDLLIGSKVIKVEEFMPDRIKVNVKVEKDEYKPGEDIEVDIEALNFFGPPAANRNYEVDFSTQRINFYPKENRNYSYYIQGINTSFSNILRQNTTDEAGKANEIFTIPDEYKNMGKFRSDLFITVFDETGRPVNRLKRLDIYTQDVFFGVKSEYYYVKTNQPVKIDLVAVDKNGKALTGVDAEVKLIRWEYKTVLSKSGGYFRYRSEEIEKVVEKKTIKINETSTSFGFIPEFSGRYELRVSAPGVSNYVQSKLYAYGWGSTSYSSFKVNNEGQIDIETDKAKYEVGDKANVLLKAPFTGKMLITVETDKVIDHFYVETDKRAASFTLDIKEEYLPNIYVSATLFRPHEESDIPLTVAHGYASLKVDNTAYKIPVTIEAPEKSRSNKQQTIKIKGKPNSALTIAIVDEGILQVANMATPDPYGYFYQKRALGVNTSNIYPYLFPEIGMIRSNTGGGMSEDEAGKRLNPLQSNRVKLVSYWSGIVETNSKGEAEYTIDIPQFSGDLRIMAVNYTGQEFGAGQKNMKVADPLVVSVALPRFLSPGDKIKVPVTLTNTTSKEIQCKASLAVEGPLQIEGQKSQSVKIAANQESQVMFAIDADVNIGEAKIELKSQALGETFTNTTDITVRPASPLQKRSGSGQIDAGASMEIPVDIKDFLENTVEGKLIVSKNPMIQFSKSLDYLVRYPYGCVEQTVSSAFPQLYYSELVGTVFEADKAKSDAVHNVQGALDRIKLMQLYNGGLTYWPGHGTETWWGSVYAAHFAIEARKAGYEVDDAFLDPLMKYIKKKLKQKELVTYYYNTNKRRQIAPRSAIYSLYVLSLAGEKTTSLLNYYRTRTEQLSMDSKYLLAGAYGLTGDMEKARSVLPSSFDGEISVSSFGGSFYSAIRDEAVALNVLLEIDPQNSQIGLMARHISHALANRRYLNTQERSFSLLAMGKIAKIAAQSDISGSITAGGKKVGSFDNSTLGLSLDEIGTKDIKITTKGSGKVYYYWESEGISADGSYLEEDNYMLVRKKFYDRRGSLNTSNRFKQNDLVLVELEIRGATSTTIENVAISDILPACFEIENPRLTTLPPGMNYPHSRSTPEYMDIRDDRINMFTRVSSSTRYYYYLVRVVSKGSYNMGPVGADAMYNGEYHSYSGGGVIVVE